MQRKISTTPNPLEIKWRNIARPHMLTSLFSKMNSHYEGVVTIGTLYKPKYIFIITDTNPAKIIQKEKFSIEITR